jgi:hypothetical protein
MLAPAFFDARQIPLAADVGSVLNGCAAKALW